MTDITYLPFGSKQLYLSSILDVYNREIIAYTIGDKQDASLVLDTLNQLPNLPVGYFLHSDQGSVYTSAAYQQAIKAKTFYLEGLTRTTTAIVDQTIREYITYYNKARIQLKSNNQSPINYRKLVG